jgi:16S rRNA (cytosine967-C5)-methyltransferase
MRRAATLPEVPTFPAPLALRWRENWGEEVVAAASRLLATTPPLDLSFPPDRPPELEGVSLMPGHLRLPARTAVATLAGYEEGRWWVQDVAASIPARLLRAGEGRTALDLCAAPGGKTMQLAAAGFRVTAVDASESRLARLSDNLARTGLAADIVATDVLTWAPAEPVDAILLDASCSATGIFRRHPDVLHRFRPKALDAVVDVQTQMLARAADWLKPGGILVYSVCSLEPEEGEQVADRFLSARSDYVLDPVQPGELASQIPLTGGRVRVLPGTFEADGGADGFFVARFRRLSRG